MASKNIHQNEYLSSIYFYLHFQYNGWFFFACMGLLFFFLQIKKTENTFFKKTFWLFFVSCIPAYFLSTLWLKLPIWIYVLTLLSAIIQAFTWFKFLSILIKLKRNFLEKYPLFLRYILFFVSIALSLKFLLQLGSTIPVLSQLAFGFRPIVIAYLHLVLLAIISLFLLFYIYANELITFNKQIKKRTNYFHNWSFIKRNHIGNPGYCLFQLYINSISKRNVIWSCNNFSKWYWNYGFLFFKKS